LGGCLLLLPQTVIHVLLDYDLEATTTTNDKEEVLFSLTRMAGGVLLAQGLSSFLLLVPLVQDIISLREESSDPRTLSVTTSRTSVAVQSVTGLLWVIVGLLDDRVNEESSSGGGGYRRETFGLLVVGFGILILSCFALMFSFWPVDYYDAAEHPETNRTNASTTASPQNNPDMEPLLTANHHNQEEAPTTHQEDEEEAAYRLLEEDGHEEVVVEIMDNGNPNSNEDDDDESQASSSAPTTSRIRGTRRLLKLAAPEVLYLYIGCITLLVRLPFSLSIPHFVSTTLGALSQGQFDRARREIVWLFVLGTIDACFDFWCIFWFGYANQRIVRGVRVDTFASILQQEIGFFDRHTSGELASRLNSDCGEMAGGKNEKRKRTTCVIVSYDDDDISLLTTICFYRPYLVLPF
jgi:ABC-type multidrug transport system fused ATPase/permease subunit